MNHTARFRGCLRSRHGYRCELAGGHAEATLYREICRVIDLPSVEGNMRGYV